MRTQPWNELVQAYAQRHGELEAARTLYKEAVDGVLNAVQAVWERLGPASGDVELVEKDEDAPVGRDHVTMSCEAPGGRLGIYAWLASAWGGPAGTMRLGVVFLPAEEALLPKEQSTTRVRDVIAGLGEPLIGEPASLDRMPDITPALWLRVASISVADLTVGELRAQVLDVTGQLVEDVVKPALQELELVAHPLREALTALSRVRARLALLNLGDWHLDEDELLENGWGTTWCVNLQDDDEQSQVWVGLDVSRRHLFVGCYAAHLDALQRLADHRGSQLEGDLDETMRLPLLDIDGAATGRFEGTLLAALSSWLPE